MRENMNRVAEYDAYDAQSVAQPSRRRQPSAKRGIDFPTRLRKQVDAKRRADALETDE